MILIRKSTKCYAIFAAIGLCVSIANAQIDYTLTLRTVSAEAQNLCETEFVFDQTELQGDYSFSAFATANPVIGCNDLVEASATQSSTFASNIITGEATVSVDQGGEFGLVSAISSMEATFTTSFDTPFLLSGLANPNGFVELSSEAGTILAELSFDNSEIAGVLPAGVYSLRADASINLTEPAAGEGFYSFTFETVPEPCPACLMMMGIIPIFHLVRSKHRGKS